MKQTKGRSQRAPDVDTGNLNKRKLLEAELLTLDAKVCDFGRYRDRIAAAGKDANAYFGKILARRDKLSKTLKKVASAGPPVGLGNPPFQRPGESLLALPIAPPRFIRKLGLFGFGTSGMVQMAAASEGTNVIAHGKHPTSGEITTVPGAYPGVVTYSGVVNVGPESIDPDEFNMDIDYFWLRNWKYLVPFPPPTVESRLTYRFDVFARTSIFWEGGDANVMAFVSVGETSNLTTGNDVVVDADGGWPLNANLMEHGPSYNGHYGSIEGSVTVQRSFMVPGGHVPAVAIVVGAVAALSMMTEVRLIFFDDSVISIHSQQTAGRVSYSYEPQLVAHQ